MGKERKGKHFHLAIGTQAQTLTAPTDSGRLGVFCNKKSRMHNSIARLQKKVLHLGESRQVDRVIVCSKKKEIEEKVL